MATICSPYSANCSPCLDAEFSFWTICHVNDRISTIGMIYAVSQMLMLLLASVTRFLWRRLFNLCLLMSFQRACSVKKVFEMAQLYSSWPVLLFLKGLIYKWSDHDCLFFTWRHRQSIMFKVLWNNIRIFLQFQGKIQTIRELLSCVWPVNEERSSLTHQAEAFALVLHNFQLALFVSYGRQFCQYVLYSCPKCDVNFGRRGN